MDLVFSLHIQNLIQKDHISNLNRHNSHMCDGCYVQRSSDESTRYKSDFHLSCLINISQLEKRFKSWLRNII